MQVHGSVQPVGRAVRARIDEHELAVVPSASPVHCRARNSLHVDSVWNVDDLLGVDTLLLHEVVPGTPRQYQNPIRIPV